jgi:hypothetical protein
MTSSLIRIIAMKPICLVLSLIFFLTSSPAQTPVVRNGHAMVYDNVMRAIILFGGADYANLLNSVAPRKRDENGH